MRLILPVLFVAALSLSAAPTPTCLARVTAQPSFPGRLVTVRVPPSCPPGGRAYVRFVSRTGTQPDSPPGFFTLRPGQQLTRRVPASWWVEGRDKYLRWLRLKEAP
ncbi:hypothetical protein GO986_18070 [Deinococcus sp. HMF7620]|uniref:SH3 domain-containing protein n=1 Tax=Deinococcus arboris TaxID=2682977 RepID=A0A7C9IDX5_9DEIO|nr:hypothetical protein [Deinococcus arboris]MVN88646.1 hypothetical protein [Deinococcus arboris]